jgi:UDP:flavonoid glycosyltransferase YjiC (YdhE family)
MNTIIKEKKRPRVLFANFPADGHFNPLTGLAVHLISIGYDVRWYASSGYAGKLNKLQIPHYPFKKAVDVSGNNFDEIFPGRTKYKSQTGKLKFDLIHAFILRGPEYKADIQEIYKTFPFDLLVADCAFTGIPFVKDIMHIPVISIGVLPLIGSSRDLPPNGLGLTPSYTLAGKAKQSLLRTICNQFIFREPNKVMHRVLDEAGIPHRKENIFDMLINKADLLLQSGTPGFEYYRSDLAKHIHFIGPLLPHDSGSLREQWFSDKLSQYKRIVLVTQGTVEKDVRKIIVPTLKAFKNSHTLVICTTGGSQTKELRAAYPQSNFIIEDFIPFNDVMPYADVYITNGGYGGVMLGIENNLPMIVAGVHEGKNEICARVGFFKLGINLKTETPLPQQIRKAVDEVTANDSYKQNVNKLSGEFLEYEPTALFAKQVDRLLYPGPTRKEKTVFHTEPVYQTAR